MLTNDEKFIIASYRRLRAKRKQVVSLRIFAVLVYKLVFRQPL